MLGSSTWIGLCFKDSEGPPQAAGPCVTMVKASSLKRWKPPGPIHRIHWPTASRENTVSNHQSPKSLTSKLGRCPSRVFPAILPVRLSVPARAPHDVRESTYPPPPPDNADCNRPRCSSSGTSVRRSARQPQNPSTNVGSGAWADPAAVVPPPRSACVSAAARRALPLDTTGTPACDSPASLLAPERSTGGDTQTDVAPPPAPAADRAALGPALHAPARGGSESSTASSRSARRPAARSTPGALPSSHLPPHAGP